MPTGSGINTKRQVANSFLGSEEFGERYGANVSDSLYVDTLYTNVFGRLPDAEGKAYWVGRLTSGAETRAEAEDKRALIDTLPTDLDQLSLLSEALNFDFASRGRDEPLSDDEIQGMQGIQGIRDRVLEASGKTNPTPNEFMKYSGRGLLHRPWVGSGKDVADIMEEWFSTRACDGFVIAATHVPGAYEDFVKYVVPELQKRGIFHKDYEGATLRDNLGLDYPAPSHWKIPMPNGGH